MHINLCSKFIHEDRSKSTKSYQRSLWITPRLMVAVATTPDGIFSMVTEKANTEISGPGDFNLLVDPKDLTAYLIYGLVIRLSQMNVKDTSFETQNLLIDCTQSRTKQKDNPFGTSSCSSKVFFCEYFSMLLAFV